MPCNYNREPCPTYMVTMAITTSQCGVCGAPESEEVFCAGHGHAILHADRHAQGVWCSACWAKHGQPPADSRLRIVKHRMMPPV